MSPIGCLKNIFILNVILIFNFALGSDKFPIEIKSEYRNLLASLKSQGTLKIVTPGLNDDPIIYFELKIDKETTLGNSRYVDIYLDPGQQDQYIRKFYERIFLTDESFIKVNNETIPLTCIFVEGQDNRNLQIDSPLFPKIIFDVYLVANDYSCTGPINPSWPEQGGKEETWDTFLRYVIKDPTIMQPTDTYLRLRWNEYRTILVN